MSSLKENTTLQSGKYKIISVLGQGGFGITYLAEQTMLDRKVAVKEFFVKEFCERNIDTSRVTLGTESSRETVTRFREKFIKEARNIAKLDHPNIVRILDIFEENGTAYYVMDYIEGESLGEMVKRCGAIAESTATRYILKAAEALEYIHKQNMKHLDIKPANIMINGKDESVLIDFGLSKQYDAGGQQTSTMLLDISEGYAPMEQYKKGGVGEFSPQTDIYALGATFFKLLTGETPPSASDVLNDGLPPKPATVSAKVWEAIEFAMQPIKNNRPQNVSEFIASIKTDATPKPQPAPEQEVDEATIVNIENKRPIAKKDKTFTVRGVTFKMIHVEGGTFTMGATSEQGSDAESDEKPAHEVTLSDYYIGETVVTGALWKAVTGNYPEYYTSGKSPVAYISWDECKAFISKLNALIGENFRMPTEAEWEYAARGGSKSRGYKYSGSNNVDDVAWYDKNSERNRHEVGTKKPNELGLYDMSGNVGEWCSDWYGDYRSGAWINPSGPSSGTHRVVRGGSLDHNARGCRCSARDFIDPEIYALDNGLRLCLSDNPAPEPSSYIPIIETYSANGVSFDMIKIEGGIFTMGATSKQGGYSHNSEKPAHEVTLSDYYIGKTEVTQALWEAVMGNNPSHFKGENLPVEKISWNDCKEFISKLNALTGKTFRMPTEAEWEYAARGGSKSRGYKYSGSNNIGDVAWYTDNSGGKTHPVCTKRPNELGLYDMSGNVREWCNDWYGDYSSAAQTNPKGPKNGTLRICRGGSWCYDAWGCRCSDRDHDVPDQRFSDYLGLRLCLSDNSEPKPSLYKPIVETYSANGVSFDMIKVEGSTFTMGATSEQGSDAYDWEKPAHQVTLSDYYIGETVVTQALWMAVMGNNPSQFKGDNLPVENISWHDCKAFISKLNALTGKTFRMPTEAEWEYAARGGTKSRGYKYSGSDNIDDVAWYGDNSVGKTHEVGTKSPNELGLYDMSGNVWEWCSDRYGSYSSAAQTNPKGPKNGTDRVCRGGCLNDIARFCRCYYRRSRDCCYGAGLRLCLSDNPAPETSSVTPSVETYFANGMPFDMIKVEGGTFTMGATPEQGSDAYGDEKPAHKVTLSDYYIGKTEVTQALWEAVMGNNPSLFKGEPLPVENISWNDCKAFISKLNALTGKNFRMPTEAEWEYAARGGSKSRGYKYSGSNTLDDVAWYGDNSGRKTHEVGTKKPNELGLYDMSGNVWEWCSDLYGDYSSSEQNNPKGSISGARHVVRGGDWIGDASCCRCSYRYDLAPGCRYVLGLRLCLSE